MPSHRKRIGFLPREGVHIIIEKLSTEYNYSQSKVTGILVEEALRSRGFLNSSFSNKNTLIDELLKNSKNNKLSYNYDNSNINSKSLKDDIKIIHEFIEFKLFKKIMNQNDNNKIR